MVVTELRRLWDMVDGPMPRGVLGLGCGDVHRVGDRWVLFLGGYSTSFRNRLYTASASGSDDPATATWTIDVDRRGRARPLLPDPPRSAWDGGGLHTPTHVPGDLATEPRIYYAGRAGRRHTGSGSHYAVGVLRFQDGRWQRHDGPIVRGDAERASALEPFVVRHDGRYLMWYLATPHEVGRGEQPDYELRTTTSLDGINEWTRPEVFSDATEGFFDNAVIATPAGWTMVLARGTNLHGTADFPAQGLWLASTQQLDTKRSSWTPVKQILDTDAASTPAWMGGGVCDPALAISSDDALVVFLTGTRRYRSWAQLAVQRVRRFQRPPVPAPFFLATGSLRLR